MQHNDTDFRYQYIVFGWDRVECEPGNADSHTIEAVFTTEDEAYSFFRQMEMSDKWKQVTLYRENCDGTAHVISDSWPSSDDEHNS